MPDVAQGAVWSDLSDPITDASGAAITAGAAAITATLYDSANVNQGTGIAVAHVTGGRYRLTKTLAANAALGTWGGVLTYNDGVNPVQTQSIDFAVVTAAQADPAGSINTQGLVLAQGGAVVADAGVLTIRRGDTTTWTIPLGTDLTGQTLWFSVKTAKPSTPTADLDDSSALINAYWIDGGANGIRNSAGTSIGTIAVATPATGEVVITLTAAYTSALAGASGLLWEVQLKNAGGAITTWTAGTLNITTDLIRRTTTP